MKKKKRKKEFSYLYTSTCVKIRIERFCSDSRIDRSIDRSNEQNWDKKVSWWQIKSFLSCSKRRAVSRRVLMESPFLQVARKREREREKEEKKRFSKVRGETETSLYRIHFTPAFNCQPIYRTKFDRWVNGSRWPI